MATQATLHSQTGNRHGATFDCQAPAKLDKADRQSLQTAGVRTSACGSSYNCAY